MAELIDQYPVVLLLPEALVALVILACIIAGARRRAPRHPRPGAGRGDPPPQP